MSRLLATRQKRSFKADEFSKTQTYWHGTTADAVDKIIAKGLRTRSITDSYEQGELAPMKGRT